MNFFTKHFHEIILPIPVLFILLVFNVNVYGTLFIYTFVVGMLIEQKHHNSRYPKRHKD